MPIARKPAASRRRFKATSADSKLLALFLIDDVQYLHEAAVADHYGFRGQRVGASRGPEVIKFGDPATTETALTRYLAESIECDAKNCPPLNRPSIW